MADHFGESEKGNSLGIAESRTHSRTPMRSLAYLELSDGNGGLILNISEDGMAVQAVQLVSPEQLSHMRFRLPKTSIPIAATGRLVWQLRSKKEAGIQFTELSEEARQSIRDWISAEASRPAAEPEAQKKSAQIEKPISLVPPAPVAAAKQTPASQAATVAPPPPGKPVAAEKSVTPDAASASTRSTTTAPSSVVSSTEKPKQTPQQPSKPLPVVPPKAPTLPSPSAKGAARPFAAGGPLPSKDETTLPAPEPKAPPVSMPANKPASPGSAFPAGRIPLRPGAPRPEAAGQPPMPPVAMPGGVPNMPRWSGGYMAPGVGMRYRKPRGWWTFTAALGIIAAVGFAGLMMIDPSTISRARLATGPHQPDQTATTPQSAPAGDSGTNSTPSTNTQIPANIPANNDSSSSSSAVAPQQTPPIPAPDNGSPAQAPPIASEAAKPQARPSVPVNPLAPSNSESSSKAAEKEPPAGKSSSSEESARAKREEASREESAAERASKNAASPNRASQPNQVTSSPTTHIPTSASNNFSAPTQQPQPSAPATSTPAKPPVTSAGQPATIQRDQDAYARTARKEEEAANSNKAAVQPPSGLSGASSTATHSSSVEIAGGGVSPVTPSVPLIGVPSGSVGATSQFHAIRIPPELQPKAAQLAGELHIGQMLSSYAPSYPVEAARERVEGIVRLDVMVAPNGNVESVRVISGPAALTAVSISAVKQWHYGETLLGGQPIEAEQYVTLVFRLAK